MVTRETNTPLIPPRGPQPDLAKLANDFIPFAKANFKQVDGVVPVANIQNGMATNAHIGAVNAAAGKDQSFPAVYVATAKINNSIDRGPIG